MFKPAKENIPIPSYLPQHLKRVVKVYVKLENGDRGASKKITNPA
jgi:hypothetical protein